MPVDLKAIDLGNDLYIIGQVYGSWSVLNFLSQNWAEINWISPVTIFDTSNSVKLYIIIKQLSHRKTKRKLLTIFREQKNAKKVGLILF